MKDCLLKQLIWKNTKSHLCEMRVLVLCVTVLISTMYAMLNGFILFSKEHSYEEVLFAEDGISRIFCFGRIYAAALRDCTDYYRPDFLSWKKNSGLYLFPANGNF